jgi:hypothetical protein
MLLTKCVGRKPCGYKGCGLFFSWFAVKDGIYVTMHSGFFQGVEPLPLNSLLELLQPILREVGFI